MPVYISNAANPNQGTATVQGGGAPTQGDISSYRTFTGLPSGSPVQYTTSGGNTTLQPAITQPANGGSVTGGGSAGGWRPGQAIPTGYASNGQGGLYNLDVNAGKSGSSGINQFGQTSDQVAQAQAAYDSAVNTLKGFIPILQQQADTSTGAINQTTQDTINQANVGETNLNNQASNATNQANQSLKTNLGGNNAYAASFGSGLSSFGEGLNNQAYQNFGNTTGGIQNNLQSGLQDLENQKVSAQKWGQNQIAGIQGQLQQGLQQVALNVNQTDIQKANAVTQIQQQAQQQMNAINGIVAQLQANIAASQQQNLSYAAQYANTYPALANNIQNLANTYAGQANKNVSSVFPGASGLYGSNRIDQNGNLIQQ